MWSWGPLTVVRFSYKLGWVTWCVGLRLKYRLEVWGRLPVMRSSLCLAPFAAEAREASLRSHRLGLHARLPRFPRVGGVEGLCYPLHQSTDYS
jgi:hypothetical protein